MARSPQTDLSLVEQSNLAVSTLITNAQNRKRSNKKRLREEVGDDFKESPSKKQKTTHQFNTNLPAPLIIENNQQQNNNNQTFGFSESEDDDDDNDSDNNNDDDDLKKLSLSDEEDDGFDIDLLNNNNNNNMQQSSDDGDDDPLKNDPYWKMMKNISNNNNNNNILDDSDDNIDINNNNNKNNAGVSIEIEINDQSMFNLDDKSDKKKKKKKVVRKYQKWQRDQGIELTQAHLALLVYRSRFRALLCTDSELEARMMSMLPLKYHPLNRDFNGIYTSITFNKLRNIIKWFINTFKYNNKMKPFELGCNIVNQRIKCGIFQLIEYIEEYKTKECSISHLNLLFLSLLWSFNIPARYVSVLRPISHRLSVNKIHTKTHNYEDINKKWFKLKPCVCQILNKDVDIDMIDTKNTDTNNYTNDISESMELTDDDNNNNNNNSNKFARWRFDDDKYLWNHRDDPVEGLSKYFKRTRTSIRNRLEHLVDPEHKAYKQLFSDHTFKNDDKDKCIKRRAVVNDNSVNINEYIDGSISIDMNDDIKMKNKDKDRKERRKAARKEYSGKRWSLSDDIYLWEYRDDCVQLLANTFKRTKTSIKMRLEVLRDINSKYRKRLFNYKKLKKKSKKLNKNKIKINKKNKLNKNILKKPDFNYLGQHFIYDKNKGSMVECIEVYVSDRKEWIHILLDKGRIHIDLSENNLTQCDCERANNKMNYVISIDKYGFINDVTPRYVEVWSNSLRNRVMINQYFNDILLHNWKIENLSLSLLYDWNYIITNELWNNIHTVKHQKQIDLCIVNESPPLSESLYRNHPIYVIDKFVKKYEIIYPADDKYVITTIKGNKVYSIKNLHDLHTRERWYKLGFVVRSNEDFVKKVRASHMSKKKDDNDGFTHLYGKWQTIKYIAPTINKTDKLPVNTRGNIELWSSAHLPKGCIHITRQNAIFAAKRMKIEYAKAMVGFDQRKGRSVPVFNGIVIHKDYRNQLNIIIDEMDIKRKEREKEKEMKLIHGLWRILVQGLIVQQQLETQKREKEINKKLITTKDFNDMMLDDHVEEF